jgi:hypothetical protein
MKSILIVLLFATQLLNAQEFSNKDIVGVWEVNKCELYNSGELIKTGYLNNTAFDNKVIEGKYAGKLDDDITSIIRAIIGSIVTFNDDSTASWDGSFNSLNFTNEYWQLGASGDLIICKYENRFRLRPLLFVGRIIALNNEGIRVEYFESGFKARLLLTKK